MASAHVVRQGECISSIAHRHGWFPADLWDAPENAELRQLRRNPNCLAPGDVIAIPELKLKSCAIGLDASHRFKLKGVPAKFCVVVDDGDEPLADKPFVLIVDGARQEGVSDGEGLIEAWIAPDARRARLEVEAEADDIWELEFVLGGLDAVETVAGAQARLANLGYGCPDSGELDEETRAAVEAFQADHELEPSGELDDATVAALEDAHDG